MEDCRRILNPRRVPPENCGVTYLYFVLIGVSLSLAGMQSYHLWGFRRLGNWFSIVTVNGHCSSWGGGQQGDLDTYQFFFHLNYRCTLTCMYIHTNQFFFPLLTIGVHLPVCTYTQTHILVSIPKIKIKLVLWDMHVRVTHCESNPHTGNLGRSVGFCLFGKRGSAEISQPKDANNPK